MNEPNVTTGADEMSYPDIESLFILNTDHPDVAKGAEGMLVQLQSLILTAEDIVGLAAQDFGGDYEIGVNVALGSLLEQMRLITDHLELRRLECTKPPDQMLDCSEVASESVQE